MMNKLQEFNNAYNEVKEEELCCVILDIKMPTGEIENIVNPNVADKVNYINNTYNDDLVHKGCSDISIEDYLFVKSEESYDFGWALCLLKEGYQLARKSWNDTGLSVVLQPGYSKIEANENTRKAFDLKEGTLIKIQPYFQIKDKNNVINTWVPSVSDILAEDWEIIF